MSLLDSAVATAPQLTPSQKLAWLRLIRSQNVGPQTFQVLVNRFGGAEAALETLPDLARRAGGKQPRLCTRSEAEAEIEAGERLGARLVARKERGYPPLLALTHGAPPLLWLRGRAEACGQRIVAIVGSRNASAGGRRMAREIAVPLGREGFVVASGLARGIDTAAHEASLETGTIAVLAGGFGRVYPPENEPLLDRIVERGAAICEMPPGWTATARDFPRRNRIISGMALGVVVIEAAKRSGSLITARLAVEQDREVFAVPGSPLDPRSDGANALIRSGATLTRHAQDVLEALAPMLEGPGSFAAPDEDTGLAVDADACETDAHLRDRLLGLLAPTHVDVDTLIREAGAPAGAVHWALTELELAGRVARDLMGRVALA